MKKIIAIAAATLLLATAANAQGGFLGALKSVTSSVSSESATSIINTVLGTVTSQAIDLKGSWTYQGVAVAADGENVLKNLAANAAMSTVEGKLDENLAKIGIKPGIATITFSNDYNFSLVSGSIKVNGTWEQEGNRVVLKFGKLYNFLTMEGMVKGSANSCELLFDASKFTTFAQKVIDIVSKISSNSLLATVSQLINQVDGMKAGFKITK